MNRTSISKTHLTMGIITIFVGLFFTPTFASVVLFSANTAADGLDQTLLFMIAGLGLACAVGMVPVGFGFVMRRPWSDQGLQLCMIGWVFAAGFSLLDSAMFALRPLHLILLMEGLWPMVGLGWIKLGGSQKK